MRSVLKPVHRVAAQKGFIDVIRSYVDTGGDVNATDSKGFSLLYWARRGGHQSICELLLTAGAIENSSEEPLPKIQESDVGEKMPLIGTISTDEQSLDEWFPEDVIGESAAHYQAGNHDLRWLEDVTVDAGLGSSEESGWIAEEEAKFYSSDVEFAAKAKIIQAKITAHLPVDDAADWNEVKIPGPLARKRHIPEISVSAIDEKKVVALIAKVIDDGWVSSSQIEEIAPLCEGAIDEVFIDVACRLVAELDGFVDEDVPHELSGPIDIIYSDLKKNKIKELEEAVEFFEDRYRGERDALTIYLSEARKNRVFSQKEEVKAGKEMADCLLEIIRMVSRNLGLLDFFMREFSDSLAASNVFDENAMDSGSEDEVVENSGREEERANFRFENILAAFELATDRRINAEHSLMIEKDLILFGFGISHAVKVLHRAGADNSSEDMISEFRELINRFIEKRNYFVERNLRLVRSVAQRYAGKGCDLSDLFQEGNLGLIRAAERWDYRLGYRFSTYAMWWIRQMITRYLSDNSRMIRIPVHVDERLRACKRTLLKYSGLPAPELMRRAAEDVGVDVDRLRKILSFEYEILSLEECSDLFESSALASYDDSADSLALADDERKKIDLILSVLDEKQQAVIRLRFGIGSSEDMTLEQVGKRFKVTRERIRQIESKALGRLAKGREANVLRDLIGQIN